MKAGVFLVLVLAAGIMGGPVCADAPPPLVLTIANQHQQVTVKREDGRILFSQNSTANVKFAGVRLGKQTRLSLQNIAGKTLWKQIFPQVIEEITIHGDWVDHSQTGMLAVFAALDAKFLTMGRSQPSLVEMVIGPQNQLVSFHTNFLAQAKPHTLTVECLPGSYAVRLDQKPPFRVPQPPAPGETGR